MILKFSNNTLKFYTKKSNYNATGIISVLEELQTNLFLWLKNTQLTGDELIVDAILEESGKVATEFETQIDEEGNEVQIPTNFRKVLNAAVSVTASLGSRTFVAKSEQLPEELRDSLLEAWDLIDSTI